MDRSCKCGSVVGSEALHEELEISNRPAGEYLFQGTLRTVNYIRGFNVEFFYCKFRFSGVRSACDQCHNTSWIFAAISPAATAAPSCEISHICRKCPSVSPVIPPKVLYAEIR